MSDNLSETEDFSKLGSSQRCTGEDRWRIQTPLVSPKEKAAGNAPSTSDSRDATRVSTAHETRGS